MLKSPWFLGFLALIINLATTFMFMKGNLDNFVPQLPEESEEEQVITRFWTFRSREIERLVLALEKERRRIKDIEMEALELKAITEAEIKELDQVRAELLALKDTFKGQIIEIEKAEESNLTNLAATYAEMEPDLVAEVFKEMDDILITKILSFTSPEVTGPIFQSMVNSAGNSDYAAQRVAKLTEMIRLRMEQE